MSPPTPFASPLGPAITSYLALKRALGRHYDHEGRVLAHLDRFLGARQSELTAESFAQWVATIAHVAPQTRRGRMRIARNLCLYRLRSEPRCFVPDSRDFPRPQQPVQPYLFTDPLCQRQVRQFPLDISVPMGGEWFPDDAEACRSFRS